MIQIYPITYINQKFFEITIWVTKVLRLINKCDLQKLIV